MADYAPSSGKPAPDDKDSQRTFQRWKSEIDNALKDTKYKQWIVKSQQITDRYRDERNKSATQNVNTKRYNILWANVQTLGPAVYGKMPKPVAERRYLDRDPAARLASLMLERTLSFQMQVGDFSGASKRAIHKDYLLPGMGQMWVRYYADISAQKTAEDNERIESEQDDEAPDNADDEGFGEVYEKIDYEHLCFDYVYWRDFLWRPSRTWNEVPWVARRSWLDYTEGCEKFGHDVAERMTFGDPKNKGLVDTLTNEDNTQLGKSKKAEVWEIWCKPERKVYFIAPESPGFTLKEEDDPLNLEGFWPCPEPLFATQTNDTLIPVPDYLEYQDQALELDDLTDRIDNLTSAVRANGTYNGEFKGIERLLQKGQDNMLIPVDDWAAFAEKGGIQGNISLVPIDIIVQVLKTLIEVREQILQDVYQITGISDIIRGQTDPNETYGAQQIKANYATGRLGARQNHVADWCSSIVKIGAELICEVFSDQSLRQMSGVDQLFADEVRQAVEGVTAPPSPPPQSQGQPQSSPMLAQQQLQQMKMQAAQAKQQEQEQRFAQALQILRSDKLRGFRVDIETDSTIADDLQNDKQAITEYMTGLFQSLESAEQIVANAPELIKPLGQTILMAARKMRVGRVLEASWEDALDQLEQRMEAQKNNPPPPDPDMIKAQAQAQVAQANVQATQARSQAETQKAQMDLQIAQQQFQSDQVEAGLKAKIAALQLQLDAQTSAQDTLTARQKSFLSYLQAVRVAEINAGVATNESQVDAKIEALLGFANIAHEATQNALDRQHEAGLATQQQAAQQNLQDTAPKPTTNAND